MAALARKGRRDRGKRRALSPQLLELVQALALEVPPLPIAAIYRRICQIVRETDSVVPSYELSMKSCEKYPLGS